MVTLTILPRYAVRCFRYFLKSQNVKVVKCVPCFGTYWHISECCYTSETTDLWQVDGNLMVLEQTLFIFAMYLSWVDVSISYVCMHFYLIKFITFLLSVVFVVAIGFFLVDKDIH